MASKVKQISLIVLCWALYLTSYVAKYSYTANINPIMTFYSVSKSEAGLISTLFFFAYGVGQVLNGLFCKFYNKKFVISGAMIISAIINGILFFQPPFAYIKYIWLVNGIAQSVLWSSIMMVLSENLDDKLLDFAVFAMATTVPVGTCIAYGGSALFLKFGTPFYKYSFLLGGTLALIVSLLWVFLYSALTVKNGDKRFAFNENTDKEIKEKTPVSKQFIFLLVSLCVIAVMINFVKDGVNTWFPTILKETFNLDDSLSAILTFALPVCGVFGSIVAIALNKLIKDYVNLLGVFFTALSLIVGFSILLFGLTNKTVLILVFIVLNFGVCACLLSAANNLVTSIAPLTLRKAMNSGLTSGVINGCCYLGSTLATYLFGLIADKSGWNTVLMMMLFVCLVPVIYSLIFLIINSKKRKKVNN